MTMKSYVVALESARIFSSLYVETLSRSETWLLYMELSETLVTVDSFEVAQKACDLYQLETVFQQQGDAL